MNHSERMKLLWKDEDYRKLMISKRIGIKQSDLSKRKRSTSMIGKNTGNKSGNWKGLEVGYPGIHRWLRLKYGNADCCENKNCNGKSNKYNWTLIPGCEYKRIRKNFKKLCQSCHMIQDYTQEWRENQHLAKLKNNNIIYAQS